MHCPACGTNNPDRNGYCDGCGAPLRGEITRVETVAQSAADTQPSWQDGQRPTMNYSSLGESFQTPASLAATQGTAKKGAAQKLKSIGKGILAAYVILTLVAAAGAFLIWKKGWIEFHWPWEQDQVVYAESNGGATQVETGTTEQSGETQSAAPIDESQEVENSAVVTAGDITSDNLDFLKGVWKGTYIETIEKMGSYPCTGGELEPLELNITKVEGRYITADIKVVYHNHNKVEHETDGIGKDITEHYSKKMYINEKGEFNFVSDPYEIGISFEYKDGVITAIVESALGMGSWKDKYILEK